MSASVVHYHTQLTPEEAVALVERSAAAAGERMTDVRRDVVMALARLAAPHSAYQILAAINKKRRKALSAMSLYRTLDFLIRLGSVVKVESQNAFKLCAETGHDHSHLMIVCDTCGTSRDIDDSTASSVLQGIARKYGHQLKHNVVELHGLCDGCAG